MPRRCSNGASNGGAGMIPQNYASRFDITEEEAARISSAAPNETEFILVYELDGWWREEIWEKRKMRDDFVGMLANALALALCVPAGPQEKTASNLAADIARIGLEQGFIDESLSSVQKSCRLTWAQNWGVFMIYRACEYVAAGAFVAALYLALIAL